MKPFSSLLAAVVILGSTSSAIAQTTWNGLRFKSSPEEVEQALKPKQMTVAERAPNIFSVAPVYEVALPSILKQVPFDVEIIFSKAGLQEIDLSLRTEDTIKLVGSLYTAADLVNSGISKSLTAKYGPPYEMSKPCTVGGSDLVVLFVENKFVDCKASWHTDGQTVSVSWSYEKKPMKLTYFISYVAASSDL